MALRININSDNLIDFGCGDFVEVFHVIVVHSYVVYYSSKGNTNAYIPKMVTLRSFVFSFNVSYSDASWVSKSNVNTLVLMLYFPSKTIKHQIAFDLT